QRHPLGQRGVHGLDELDRRGGFDGHGCLRFSVFVARLRLRFDGLLLASLGQSVLRWAAALRRHGGFVARLRCASTGTGPPSLVSAALRRALGLPRRPPLRFDGLLLASLGQSVLRWVAAAPGLRRRPPLRFGRLLLASLGQSVLRWAAAALRRRSRSVCVA